MAGTDIADAYIREAAATVSAHCVRMRGFSNSNQAEACSTS